MPRINELTSRECGTYIESGGDLAVVPVGCTERLGPHLPLGVRGMVADAIAMRLADKAGGLCLPLIPYSAVYDTAALVGSTYIHPDVMHRYLTDLCDELVASRFRRIVFISFHEELYYLCHEYFQTKGLAVAWVHPDRFVEAGGIAAALDAHGRELWRLAACLMISGQEALLHRVLDKTRETFGQYPVIEHPNRAILRRLGHTGCPMLPGEWAVYPVPLGRSLEPIAPWQEPEAELCEIAAAELDAWLDTLAAPLSSLSTYQAFIDSHPLSRPQ